MVVLCDSKTKERTLHWLGKEAGSDLALIAGKKLGDKAVAPLLSQASPGVSASDSARAGCKGRESKGKSGKGQLSLPFAGLASLLLASHSLLDTVLDLQE